MGFCPELAFVLFIFFTCFYALQGAEENEPKAENRGQTPVFLKKIVIMQNSRKIEVWPLFFTSLLHNSIPCPVEPSTLFYCHPKR
jgi:hypothetical protein